MFSWVFHAVQLICASFVLAFLLCLLAVLPDEVSKGVALYNAFAEFTKRLAAALSSAFAAVENCKDGRTTMLVAQVADTNALLQGLRNELRFWLALLVFCAACFLAHIIYEAPPTKISVRRMQTDGTNAPRDECLEKFNRSFTRLRDGTWHVKIDNAATASFFAILVVASKDPKRWRVLDAWDMLITICDFGAMTKYPDTVFWLTTTTTLVLRGGVEHAVLLTSANPYGESLIVVSRTKNFTAEDMCAALRQKLQDHVDADLAQQQESAARAALMRQVRASNGMW